MTSDAQYNTPAVHSPRRQYSAAPTWMDWLAPLGLALVFYCFTSLNFALYGALEFGIRPGLRSILPGIFGLAGFIAIFLLIPPVSARGRTRALVFLGVGLAVSFLAPHVLPFSDGIFTTGPLGEILDIWELPLLPVQIVNAATYGLIALAWFSLRGFPVASYAWITLILPGIMLIDALVDIWWMSSVPFPQTTQLIPDLIFWTITAAIFFGFAFYPAILTLRQFRAPRPTGTTSNLNTLALLSFVFAFVFGIAAIILGHLALSKIQRTGEDGHRLAVAGVILGYVNALFILAFFAIFISKVWQYI